MSAAADPGELLTEARREALARLGFSDPPEALEALLPAVARGHHLAVLAGDGSGKEALYALAAGVTCDPGSPEVQALALCPTHEAAWRVARFARALNREEGLATLIWPPGGALDEETRPERPVAHLLAGRPAELLAEVRAGRLPLEHLRLVIVDGLEALRETGAWAAAETLVDTLDPGGQRIVCALEWDAALEKLMEERLPRARRWPPELLERGGSRGEGGSPPTTAPILHYGAGGGLETRLELLGRGVRALAAETGAERAFVYAPGADAAHAAADALAAAGLRLADPGEEAGVVVAWGDDEGPRPEAVAAFLGLPVSLAALRRWLGDAAARLVVIEPAHLPQLRILARRAGWRLRELPGAPAAEDRDAIARFRDGLERELEASDAGAELLLLEPLLEAHGPVRVAAALARLLRRKSGRPPTGGAALEETSVRPAWTRIFVNVGKKDGAGPGDLVGAITGETPATGAQVGKIEVRHTFSLVDVDSQIADEVIRGLRGKTIRNREVVARADRTE